MRVVFNDNVEATRKQSTDIIIYSFV